MTTYLSIPLPFLSPRKYSRSPQRTDRKRAVFQGKDTRSFCCTVRKWEAAAATHLLPTCQRPGPR